MRRIRRTLATTDYVPSDGGFRLSLREPTVGIRFVQLDERHRNMIRQLSLQLPAQSETSES
jgi:hypothetical protein